MSDVTIVGAGIIGLLVAREYIDLGASVTLIDKNLVGREASWAGGGMLFPINPEQQPEAVMRLFFESMTLFPKLIQQLYEVTEIDPQWLKSGLLISQSDDVQLLNTWCQQNGVITSHPPTELLSKLGCLPKEPLWLPEIYQVRNPRLLKALKYFLTLRNVTFMENCTLTGVKVKGQRIDNLETTSGLLPVNHLVLATGAWSGENYQKIFPDKAYPRHLGMDVYPVKGQMIVVKGPEGYLDSIILQDGQYMIPRKDGRIIVGSTVESMVFDKSITTEVRENLTDFMCRLMPDLKKCVVEHQWAGLRPATISGIPFIGCHQKYENLSFNCGHFRNGLSTSLASAKLLVDLIEKRPPTVDPLPYELNKSNFH